MTQKNRAQETAHYSCLRRAGRSANMRRGYGLKLTAWTHEHFNALTIMFGATGMIRGKDVYIAFIKPESYTWEFVRDNDYFTVSYFPKELNGIHKVFGYKSGITPEILEHGVAFSEAKEVYVCRKLYMKQMDRNAEPAEIGHRNYRSGHTVTVPHASVKIVAGVSGNA